MYKWTLGCLLVVALVIHAGCTNDNIEVPCEENEHRVDMTAQGITRNGTERVETTKHKCAEKIDPDLIPVGFAEDDKNEGNDQ